MHHDHEIEVQGLKLHCRISGAATGPWVMFSNSLLTDLSLWDAQEAVLADKFRILRYDQRGHGGSDVPGAPCTYDNFADDAIALMDAFGIGAVTWVGISMGSATGINLATRYPQRIEGLLLCDGPPKSAPTSQSMWDERIGYAKANGMSAMADITVQRWFLPEAVAAGLPAVERVRKMIASTSLDGFRNAANALQEYDFTACLPQIKVKTTLLVGSHDGVLPDTMRQMSTVIPGAQFAIIQNAGHLICAEQPELFNQAMLQFLSR